MALCCYALSFNHWFADKTQQAGAIVAPGLQADDLLREGGLVTGIKAGGDSIPANVVFACDGVNSVLARKAGLGAELKAVDIKQEVKEVLALPREIIDQRFGLSSEEGMAWKFVGSCTQDLPGGAFIYIETVSPSELSYNSEPCRGSELLPMTCLLEGFKSHPAINRLLAGNTLVEYYG